MRDLYELIGVPETASEVWIERSYQAARHKIEANGKLPSKRKQAALAELDSAYAVLSDPVARAQFDSKFEQWREARANGGVVAWLKKSILLLVLLAVIGASVYWYRHTEQERVRLEQERVASDLAMKKKLAEIAEQRQLSEERLQREAIERQQEEERRLELARAQRAEDAKSQRFVVDDRYEKAQREKRAEAERRERQNEELRQQLELARIRNQAQAEMERQRRFIAQREREEAIAAQQRAAAESARQMQEQGRNR
ncbi:MAG: hypothetical protein ACKO1K_11200 [Burkholderiales bacterium]